MIDSTWLNVQINKHTITASVVVCGTLLTVVYTRTRRRKTPQLPKEYTKVMQLFDSERIMSAFEPLNVTTLTFYQGDVDQAAEQLSTRVAEIVAANPWLGGRFSDVTGKVNVHYSEQTHPECFVMNERITIESPASNALIGGYFDYAKHPSFMAGNIGTKLLNNFGPSGALFRVTVTPINTDSFAVCTSLQHAIGDGHTFYAINHMLSTDGCVTALDTTRHKNFPEEAACVLGKKEAEFLTVLSPSLLMGYLVNIFWRKSTRRILSVEVAVNGSAMEETKKQANAAALTNEVGFVSTNDVLTSAFFKAAKTSANLMCMDMRSRINLNGQDLDKTAGNLEQFMMYRPTDVATPSLIRKSLRTMKRAATPATPMPGFWDMSTGNTCVVSNWATFYKEVKIQHSKQIVHLPLPDSNNLIPFKELGIIFRPSNDRLAFLSAGSARMINNLEKELGADLLITK